jgi:GntR family transcriptional regulator/MocR family aminotransferase
LVQPFTDLITPDPSNPQPIYLQIGGKLTSLITGGRLAAGHRLPSTRELATLLGVHRKTVIRAYDELLVQGWLESQRGRGTFVATRLPGVRPRSWALPQAKEKYKAVRKENPPARDAKALAGFLVPWAPHLEREDPKYTFACHLDDGLPDPRIAPLSDLARGYRAQLLTGRQYTRLGYNDPRGSSLLRETLPSYLDETRGLKITENNLLIVRGTVMGVYLISTGLIRKGDVVAVSDPTWAGAVMNFAQAGAELVRIGSDGDGLAVDELEALCRQRTVRLVYITSHHNYPTTLPLRPDRRLQLLRLAETHRFIILEDDYDYDFHYQNKPHLPLASADKAGMVLYCGSFTKTISPAIRVGYIVGPENVIQHLAKIRRIIDRQGDTLLENAMAMLLQNGVIQRHLRKALKLYKERRDVFCELLRSKLGESVNFHVPEGGMAVWTRFDPSIDLEVLAAEAAKKDLFISSGRQHDTETIRRNATRLGFASSTIQELHAAVEILSGILNGNK